MVDYSGILVLISNLLCARGFSGFVLITRRQLPERVKI